MNKNMTREEAIQIIRETYHTDEEMKALESLIPELRESEDEKVRALLVSLVQWAEIFPQSGLDSDTTNKMLSYLEKQKEQKPTQQNSEEVFNKIDSSFRKGREVGFREGMESARPAEWSEEDERMLERAIHIIAEYSDIDEKESEIVQNWLNKSLRPQPKQEWNEYDNEMFHCICAGLCNLRKLYEKNEDAVSDYNAMIEWFRNRFKSIRPSWKPSEEQMEAFCSVLEHEAERVGSSKYLEKANSLYEQLKKL